MTSDFINFRLIFKGLALLSIDYVTLYQNVTLLDNISRLIDSSGERTSTTTKSFANILINTFYFTLKAENLECLQET